MRLLLGIFVFFIWASICRFGYVCELKGLCDEEAVVEDIRPKTLDLILDDTVTFLKDYDQFRFDKDSILPFLNESNEAYLDSLISIMKSDSLIFLTLTGAYRPSEQDHKPASGFFEDLGTARADAIRGLLVDKGVTIKNISLDFRASAGENLLAPVAFTLYTDRGDAPEEFAKIQFVFTNMTFSDANFEKGSPVFVPGDALIAYADSVKTYLELNPDKTLTIIGHCDSDGTDEYNLELGKNRAENAKNYFVDLGVSATINTLSKGESEPVVPNDSEINMQKNRRVNFVIE